MSETQEIPESARAWVERAAAMYARNASCAAIGDELGVSAGTVSHWLRRAGVEMRKGGPVKGSHHFRRMSGRPGKLYTAEMRRLDALEQAADDILVAWQYYQDTEDKALMPGAIQTLARARGLEEGL